MTLQEVKEEYAKEKHYDSWNQFFFRGTEKAVSNGIDEISKRYAKAKLEEAAENVSEQLKHYGYISQDGPGLRENVLQSILNTPLD